MRVQGIRLTMIICFGTYRFSKPRVQQHPTRGQLAIPVTTLAALTWFQDEVESLRWQRGHV